MPGTRIARIMFFSQKHGFHHCRILSLIAMYSFKSIVLPQMRIKRCVRILRYGEIDNLSQMENHIFGLSSVRIMFSANNIILIYARF
jgi:hypothetical protein